MIALATALLLLWTLPAAAQEFVLVDRKLSDREFYRAVACAARPARVCRKPFLRWPQDQRNGLSVGLVSVAPGLPPYRQSGYEAGLEAAIREINGLGAGITLRRDDTEAAIAIHVVPTPPGHIMRDTGVEDLDGYPLALGRVALRARGGEITQAVIAISAQARRREIAHILLEEITQSLGLMTDIKGGPYHRSVFSEVGNSAVRLQGQDAMAVRRHYDTVPDASGIPRQDKES